MTSSRSSITAASQRFRVHLEQVEDGWLAYPEASHGVVVRPPQPVRIPLRPMTTPRQRLIVEASDDTLHIPLPPELRHRRLVVTMEPVDRAASPPSGPNRDPEHIKRVLAETRGAWGNMTADEIDQMIEESRRSDCSDPWEVCREIPS